MDDPPKRRTKSPPNPWRAPDEQPQRGPQPKRRVPWWVPHPLEFVTPWPVPGRPSEVGLDPRFEQLPDTVELPATGGPVLLPPRTGFPSPPPKHERQVKVAIFAKGQILVAFNAVTEGKDFYCRYLGKRYRRRSAFTKNSIVRGTFGRKKSSHLFRICCMTYTRISTISIGGRRLII